MLNSKGEHMVLNSKNVNASIIPHILSDNEMRNIGFTDFNPDVWYYTKVLYPDDFGGISFNVSIPKDGSDISIDVLDEAFCQPFDYQFLRSVSTQSEIADQIFYLVEDEMKYLQDAGVLSGHEYGDYI